MSHSNNPPQIKIEGFTRLLIQCTDVEHLENRPSGYPNLQHSGVWMSKDRHWLIAPTSGRVGYQLLPISQDAGIRISRDFKVSRLLGTLDDILKAFNKMNMYVTTID